MRPVMVRYEVVPRSGYDPRPRRRDVDLLHDFPGRDRRDVPIRTADELRTRTREGSGLAGSPDH